MEILHPCQGREHKSHSNKKTEILVGDVISFYLLYTLYRVFWEDQNVFNDHT